MSSANAALALAGRILLTLIFVTSAWNMAGDPAGTAEYMGSKGVPVPGFLLWCAVGAMLVGSLSIILGYRTRLGALALIVFLIPTTLVFHNIASDATQTIQFYKNAGLLGGLLLLVAHGPGALSLDARKRRRKHSAPPNRRFSR